MHRLKLVAHDTVYGQPAGSTRSRTSSPRYIASVSASPHVKNRDASKVQSDEDNVESDAQSDGLELKSIERPLRHASPRPGIDRRVSSHPQQDVDVPPDIAAQDPSILPRDVQSMRRLSKRSRLRAIFLRILFFSWSNVLLVMVPVAIAVHFAKLDPIAVFVTSAVAIIPLAALLGYGTEELAKRFGPATGALLNVTFGNATELIVFIIGVVKGELDVVQAAIIGSVLGNLLLILGMAFFLGGLRYKEQYYNNVVTQTTGCCLLLALTSLSIPTAFHASFTDNATADDQVLKLSYATSIVLLIIYGVYLCFQLKTHAYLYRPTGTVTDIEGGTLRSVASPSMGAPTLELHDTMQHDRGTIRSNESPSTIPNNEEQDNGDDDDDEVPEIPLLASLLLLVASTGLVALIAEFLVSSINAVVMSTSLSEQFVGLIILPIVGNAAEHITAVTVAWKNKMDLSIGIALGSSLQIVLLVAPVTVLIAWIVGQPLTLFFSLFETLSVFATVLIVTYLVIDGRSNYLEGVLLMAAYLLIAIASILYPSRGEEV